MIRNSVGFFSKRCPHCKSIDFRIADARNTLETVLQRLLQPYWCSLCGRHFFLFRWQVPIEGTT
jgi:transposase-like protein